MTARRSGKEMEPVKSVTCCALLVALSLVSCGSPSDTATLSVFRWDLNMEGRDGIADVVADCVGVTVKPLTAPWTGWADKLNTMIAFQK